MPDFGDTRGGKRQVLTVNETHIFSHALVNEARVGYNRININFDPNVVVNPADLGINNGINFPLALPQITITSLGLNFGGPANFPQGRTVTTCVASDTATYLRGNHIIKFGGEYRRASVKTFTNDPGTFTYASVPAFQTGLGNSFNITLGDRQSTLIIPAVGGFVQDSLSLGPKVKLDLGLRYDFIGSPTEPNNNLVVFDASTDALVRLGSGIDQIHKNGSDFQPRLGVIWNPTGNGIVFRAAYAVMINQTNTGYVGGSASNPPLATPLNVSGAVKLETAYTTAQAAGLAPTTTNPDFQPGRMQTWNVNVEKELRGTGVMVGYFGSYGDRLRIPVNINQFVNGVRPYPTLSATSPISPGAALGNITEVQSAGWSHYKGLWITANRRMSKGLQVRSSYTLSKSTDTNSYDGTGAQHQRVAAEQLRPGRQRRAVGLRRAASLQPERHLRAAVPRQLAERRLAGRRRAATAVRQPGQHHHQHQHVHRRDVAPARSGWRSVGRRRRQPVVQRVGVRSAHRRARGRLLQLELGVCAAGVAERRVSLRQPAAQCSRRARVQRHGPLAHQERDAERDGARAVPRRGLQPVQRRELRPAGPHRDGRQHVVRRDHQHAIRDRRFRVGAPGAVRREVHVLDRGDTHHEGTKDTKLVSSWLCYTLGDHFS